MKSFKFRVSSFWWKHVLWRSAGAGESRKPETRNWKLLLAFAALVALTSCGYHTAGHAVRLPSDLRTIVVPAFENRTNTYHIEQVLAEAVVHEFTSRSQYRIVNRDDGTADAVLRGVVMTTNIAPVTYDSETGRASTALVTIGMRVTLVGRNGKVLYQNNGYSFREQYQISRDPSGFFQEEGVAMQRMARDFARTLVSNVLEAF